MSTEIESVDAIPLSDTKRLPFQLSPQDTVEDFESVTIGWQLQQGSEVILDLSDDGVSIVNKRNDIGRFEIELEQGATSELDPGRYYERVRLTDADGEQTTWYSHLWFVDL